MNKGERAWAALHIFPYVGVAATVFSTWFLYAERDLLRDGTNVMIGVLAQLCWIWVLTL